MIVNGRNTCIKASGHNMKKSNMDKPKGDFEAWPLYGPSRTKSWLFGLGCESDQLRLTHRD